ncbi:MAG: hypothetical protein DSZ24_01775, partial [Thermodesulfatator sp.]
MRHPSKDIPEDRLLCPDCGGRLVFAARDSERIALEDYLLTGPVALLYWDLPLPAETMEGFWKRQGYAVRRFTSREELRRWLRFLIPQVLLYGTENPQVVAQCEEFLQN